MLAAYLIVAIAHDDHQIVDILIFKQFFQHFQGAHIRRCTSSKNRTRGCPGAARRDRGALPERI